MAERFHFGLVVRGQAAPGEDIGRRFEATLRSCAKRTGSALTR